MTEKTKCSCGCCHAVDHGACDGFEAGANGRCVYCDHGKECHPGKGKYFNGPLEPGERNLFDSWSGLNQIIADGRSRFDVLREELPKCKTKAEARRLIRGEGFGERYPLLPDWLPEGEETAFSPGPWKDASLAFSAGPRCLVETSNGRCIDVADPRNRKTDEEDLANARLIAAAPEMYKALKYLLGNELIHSDEWLEKTRAALRKAEKAP